MLWYCAAQWLKGIQPACSNHSCWSLPAGFMSQLLLGLSVWWERGKECSGMREDLDLGRVISQSKTSSYSSVAAQSV